MLPPPLGEGVGVGDTPGEGDTPPGVGLLNAGGEGGTVVGDAIMGE